MLSRRGFRAFSSSSYRPFRYPFSRKLTQNIPNGTTVTFYRVNFKRTPVWKTIARTLLYAGTAYGALELIDLFLSHVKVDNVSQRLGGNGSINLERKNGLNDEEDCDRVDEDEWFIPFPWTKKQPFVLYKKSDPDRQALDRFIKDEKRRKAAFDRLVSIVCSDLARDGLLMRYLGKDVKRKHHWLTIEIPYGYPGDYRVQGLVVGKGTITLGERLQTRANYETLQRIMLPKGAWSANWAFAEKKWDHLKRSLARLYGERPQDILKGAWASGLSRPGRERREQDEKQKQTKTISGKDDVVPPGPKISATAIAQSSTEETLSDSSHPARVTAWASKLPRAPLPTPGDNREILKEFLETKGKRAWSLTELPRGTLLFRGMIQFVGSDAAMVCDILAIYDVRTDKFIAHTLSRAWSWKKWLQELRRRKREEVKASEEKRHPTGKG